MNHNYEHNMTDEDQLAGTDIIFFPVSNSSGQVVSNGKGTGGRRLIYNQINDVNKRNQSESKQKYYSFVRPISASNRPDQTQ
jgi:hypothetical protein